MRVPRTVPGTVLTLGVLISGLPAPVLTEAGTPASVSQSPMSDQDFHLPTTLHALSPGDSSATALPEESMTFEPEVEPCPYAEEVKELETNTAQFSRALELGCEHDVDGSIEFEDPIEYMDDGTPVMGIINPLYALTDVEMLDQGIISQTTFEEGREAAAAARHEVPN